MKAIPRCTAEATSCFPNVVAEDKESSGTQSLTLLKETVPLTLHDKAVPDPDKETRRREEQMEVKSKISYMKLFRAVQLPATFPAIVPVEVTKVEGTAMVKPLNNLYDTPQVENASVKVNEKMVPQLLLSCEFRSGTPPGEAVEAEVVHTSTEKRLVGNKEVVEKQDLLHLFNASVNSSQESVERTKWR